MEYTSPNITGNYSNETARRVNYDVMRELGFEKSLG